MNYPSLSGSDYFHLLVDRKMLRNGLVGNISRIHLELSAEANLLSIAERLDQNQALNTVGQLKVVHRWPLLPKWDEEKGKRKNVLIQFNISRSEFNANVLNRKVDNENGLVFIDLCELEDGTKHMVISMHHVLFDHQGVMNFLHSLAEPHAEFPLFPDMEKPNRLKVFQNFWFMTVYMLKRSSSKLGTLVDKKLRPATAPTFKVIEFTESETEQIEKNAWSAGARIGQSAYYISATAKVVNETLCKRGDIPPYLWFSVPHNNRRKGTLGHLVSNQLSFLFFRLMKEELTEITSSVSSINYQLKQQLKARIIERYSDLQDALRRMPLFIYEAMVDLASKGKMSSFGYSDLGEQKTRMKEFLGVKVLRIHHYPPVPSPPGFNVIATKVEGELQFVWAYFDEALNHGEIEQMENSFRNGLLVT